MRYLISARTAAGSFGPPTGQFRRGHALATLVMCNACLLGRWRPYESRRRHVAQQALDCLTGELCYNDDPLVDAWWLQAVGTAPWSGITVDPDGLATIRSRVATRNPEVGTEAAATLLTIALMREDPARGRTARRMAEQCLASRPGLSWHRPYYWYLATTAFNVRIRGRGRYWCYAAVSREDAEAWNSLRGPFCTMLLDDKRRLPMQDTALLVLCLAAQEGVY